jgi:hypothetical protein
MPSMKATKDQYLLILLTKNEEDNIVSVSNEIKALENPPLRVIVVDDSIDSTKEKISGLDWQVVSGHGQLGAAYQMGLNLAESYSCEYVITMDGDGQADPKEIENFLRSAREQNADLVLGSRFLDKELVKYSYPAVNRMGVFLLASYLSLETGQKISDSHGGIRCHSMRACKTIRVRGQHTYVQESIVSAHRQGLKIIEIPSQWRPRNFGESKVVNSVLRYAVRVAPTLARCSRFNFLKGFGEEPRRL